MNEIWIEEDWGRRWCLGAIFLNSNFLVYNKFNGCCFMNGCIGHPSGKASACSPKGRGFKSMGLPFCVLLIYFWFLPFRNKLHIYIRPCICIISHARGPVVILLVCKLKVTSSTLSKAKTIFFTTCFFFKFFNKL